LDLHRELGKELSARHTPPAVFAIEVLAPSSERRPFSMAVSSCGSKREASGRVENHDVISVKYAETEAEFPG
jgi:hypothetical protein